MPIDLITLGAALLTGLLGGVHCVAMCGGIATALSASAGKPGLGNAFALNGGRVLGYTVAGAIVGGFGGGLLMLARSDAVATGLRVAMGAVLLMVAARLMWPHALGFLSRGGGWLWRALRRLQSRLPAAGPLRPWAMGLLWGWLPCGLSSTVLVAAWLEASALHGALVMASFGLGTMATMVPVTWSGARLGGLLAHRAWRAGAASFVALAGLVTMAGPWLAGQPAIHAVLEAMGCRSV